MIISIRNESTEAKERKNPRRRDTERLQKFITLMLAGMLTLAAMGNTTFKATINIAGSTSVQPLAERLAEAFMRNNAGVKIAVQGGDSGVGLKRVTAGATDIGACSRELKPEEQSLYSTRIAQDGVAVIVNKTNPVTNLSREQLRKIYSGEYQNWKEVGGPDRKIIAVNREIGSGTRETFEALVMGSYPLNASDFPVQPSTGAVQLAVAFIKEAIGYTSLGSFDSKVVKAVAVDNIFCTRPNIRTKKYMLQRPLLFVTKGAPAGQVRVFIDWVLGGEGQKIVNRELYSGRK
jgi:phosphate transport system substrate-binding protein